MDIQELSRLRFSARKFTDEKVSEADIDYILETVRLAPSACNRQPWKFVVVESDEAKDALCRCYDREWFRTAPLYVVCLRDINANWVRGDGKEHGNIDVAIATEHLCLAAAEGFEVVAIIPLGHIAADCHHGEKVRKPLDEIVERM